MTWQDKERGIGRQAFMNLLRQGRLSGAWLLEGPEDKLREDAVREIRATLLTPGLEEMDGAVLTDPDPDVLIASCETVPFASPMRLVIVREQTGLTGRAEADERIVDYVGRVPPTTLLLFLLHGDADLRKKLPKALNQDKRLVSFRPMRDAELQGWVIARFAELDLTCDPAAARELIFISGADSNRLSGEIGKIAALCTDGFVPVSAVQAAATRTGEYTVFQMIDAVMAGRRGTAFVLMQGLLEAGQERLGILALLLRQYRLLQQLKIMQYEKIPPQEYARRLGVQGFAADRLVGQARQMSNREIKQSLEACLDTEYRVKSGRMPEEGCLEALMLRLFAIRRETRGQ